MMTIGDDDDENNEEDGDDVPRPQKIMKIKMINFYIFRVSNLKWTTWETS